MSYNNAPEHVKLAVELIRQIENMQFPEETVVEAMMLIIQDTLNKMRPEERDAWRRRLIHVLKPVHDEQNT